MSFWVPASVISPVIDVGGKGLHLQKLMSWEAPVPPFFVITTECFKYFHSHGKLPEEIEGRFETFFKTHETIALRSSMIGEDNLDASFAGLFETILDVKKDKWKESLVKIYDSVNSPRVHEYLTLKKLKVELLMAVVAQAQVNVEKSGVLFTRSPVEPTSALAIDAAFGMGEGVVSGHSQVDHYQFTRSGELILQVKNNSGPVLTEKEQKDLISTSLEFERRNGLPSDIEWGYKEGKLYIFQIRPITRPFEPLTFFVDTNLSESYPGTISPFSAKFVQKAYHNVFRESAIIMGAKGKRLEVLDSHYAKLISCVDDHLYYNLEHYYAVLRALPGGEKNIENWHKMIGGKLSGSEVPRHATVLTKVETVNTLSSLIRLGWNHKNIFEPFLSQLEKTREEIIKEQEGIKNSGDSISYLSHLIERPMGFGLTVVNDIFIMMGLGYLTRTFKRKGISEDNVIDLLKTNDGVDSLKPLELFNALVTNLSAPFVTKLEKAVMIPGLDPYKETFAALTKDGHASEVKQVEDFLLRYGDRSFEELKLESLPLKNNPKLFVHLVKWAKNNPSLTKSVYAPAVSVDLSWSQKKCVKFTREAIAMREATRLWRGKFYHLLRMQVLQMGHQLVQEDPRFKECTVLDFFSLNHLEWLAYKEGKLDIGIVLKLIRERRPWQTKRQQYPEMIEWVESERLPALDQTPTESEISGQGVSPGITEGVALVLESPNDALESDLKDFILVTKNTDPAWVYIMSRSLGLISEKGSLLSHTAIIGRELCIPTIVGVKSATNKIKTGDRLRMNATNGKIEII
ncbi:MAG TPA: PEP/pyruvate-binding domain-containing protein [Bacteriovoracaceae bacterium]|nr:PEP/pyruvate-binding domain-containing protein [Bacteriovoracaceae bacterium]